MRHHATLTLTVDTTEVRALEALLLRIESACDRLDHLKANPPEHVHLVEVPVDIEVKVVSR